MSSQKPTCPTRKKVLPELEKHQKLVNQISEFGSNGSYIFDPNFEKHFPANFDKSPFDQIQESYDPLKSFDENKIRSKSENSDVHAEEKKRRITDTINQSMQDSGNSNSADWMFDDTVGYPMKQNEKPAEDTKISNYPATTSKSYKPNDVFNPDMLEFDRASVLSEMSAQQAELAMIRRNSAVSLLGNSQFSVYHKNQKPKCLGKRSLPDLGILKNDKIKKFDDYYIGRPSVIRKSRKLAHNIGQAITDLPRRFSRKLSITELNLPKKSSVFKHLVNFSLIFQLAVVIGLLVCYNHVNLSVKFENFDGDSEQFSNWHELNHENRLVSDDRDYRSIPHHRGSHMPKKGVKEILKNLDTTINPCQDFYKFSCGNWRPSYKPKNKDLSIQVQPYVSRLSEAQQRGYQLLANELAKPDPLNSVPVNEDTVALINSKERSKRVVSQLFKQCVNYSNANDVNEKSHIPWLETLPSWPMITKLESEFSSFASLLINYHRKIKDNTNDLGFFRFMTAFKNTKQEEPIIGIAQLGLYFTTKEYYTSYENDEKNAKLKDIYVNLVMNVAKAVAEDLEKQIPSQQTLYRAAHDVYELESYLANFTVSQRDSVLTFQHNHHAPTPTLNDFQKTHPYIGDIVKLVISDVYMHEHADYLVKSTYVKTVVDQGNLHIREINPEYFDALQNMPFTLQTVQNWLMFRAVQAKTFALPNRYRYIQNTANAAFHNIDRNEFEVYVKKERKSTCIQVLGQYYQWQMSHIYTELIGHYDKSQTMKSVNRTTEAILEAYEGMMMPNEWLDRETSDSALEKLEEMVTLLGYELNSTRPHNVFLFPDANSTFFETILKYETMLSRYKLMLHGYAKVRTDWQLPAHMVNAFYSPVYNAFTIPLGIMGNSSRNTPAVNYGRLGSIIGHEISHGFDSYGRKFNEIGDFENWWTNFTEQGYDERSSCFLKQFGDKSRFKELDPELTLAENIADSAGLKASYLALESQYGQIYLDRQATGTTFTNKQLFFIAFAQNSCSKSTPEYDLLAHRTNTHAPDKYRVLGTLSNQPEFAEAFQCETTDFYNPETKCSIW